MSSSASEQPGPGNGRWRATLFTEEISMKYALLAFAGAAIVFTAAPADARRGHETIRVGYTFGPRYAYTDFGLLPQPVVRRYHLRHDFRYVYRDGFVYVVNPHTYRVVRVLRS
jgi:hypothetical protein